MSDYTESPTNNIFYLHLKMVCLCPIKIIYSPRFPVSILFKCTRPSHFPYKDIIYAFALTCPGSKCTPWSEYSNRLNHQKGRGVHMERFHHNRGWLINNTSVPIWMCNTYDGNKWDMRKGCETITWTYQITKHN